MSSIKYDSSSAVYAGPWPAREGRERSVSIGSKGGGKEGERVYGERVYGERVYVASVYS